MGLEVVRFPGIEADEVEHGADGVVGPCEEVLG